jgi:hypothetical protein
MSAGRKFVVYPDGWRDHPALTMRGDFYDRRSAWAWLMDDARYKDGVVNVAGQDIELRRGELAHTPRFMARAWGWDDKTVRNFIRILEQASLISVRNSAGQKVISICNYGEFSASGANVSAPVSAPNSAEIPPKFRANSSNLKEGKEGKEEVVQEASLPVVAEATRTRPRRRRHEDAQASLLPTADVVDLPVNDEPRQAMVLWNETAAKHGLDGVSLKSNTSTYIANRRALLRVLEDRGGLDGWRDILARIPNNPWNLGANASGWKCNLAYLLKPGNIEKLGTGGVTVTKKEAPLDWWHQRMAERHGEGAPVPDDFSGTTLEMEAEAV